MSAATKTDITLNAADGTEISAYLSEPETAAKGVVIVIQEIFGVNEHIRDVADGFAAEGFAAIAPRFFNRLGRDDTLGYAGDDIALGKELAYSIDWQDAVKDVAAAIGEARRRGLKAGVVGYCWGGSLAWLAATRLEGVDAPDAVASYYGSKVPDFVHEKPHAPVIMHLGAEDPTIPPEAIKKIQDAQPDMSVFVYDGADHGFNCDRRGSYHAEAARLARQRTLLFFEQQLAAGA